MIQPIIILNFTYVFHSFLKAHIMPTTRKDQTTNNTAISQPFNAAFFNTCTNSLTMSVLFIALTGSYKSAGSISIPSNVLVTERWTIFLSSQKKKLKCAYLLAETICSKSLQNVTYFWRHFFKQYAVGIM